MTEDAFGRDTVLVVGDCRVARVLVADTYLRRLRGMLGRREMPEALLLVPGGAVHGVGMTRSLDVAMLAPTGDAGDLRAVRTAVLRPFGLALAPRGVSSVLEAPVGSFARWGLSAGAVVRLEAADGRRRPVRR